MTQIVFTWDEAKNRSNRKKHKVSFETAARVFDDPFHLSVQDRVEDGEERWQTLGLVDGVTLLLVAHTVAQEQRDEIIGRMPRERVLEVEQAERAPGADRRPGDLRRRRRRPSSRPRWCGCRCRASCR